MKRSARVPILLCLIAALPASLAACASDLAQGYRSTPDYPAYSAATCTSVATTQALNKAAENYVERGTGMNLKGAGPSGDDMFGGLLMAFVFALAEDRPPGVADACAGVGAAQAASARREGY